MTVITRLISDIPYMNWPNDLVGWLGFGLMLASVLYLVFRWRRYHTPWKTRQIVLLITFILLVPLTSLFGGIRLPPGPALSPPGIVIEPVGPALLVLAAIPWVLAGGILGPGPAAGLAAFSGLLIGLWDSHSPFTMVEFALMGVIASAAFNQRYRTIVFRALRRPLFMILVLSVAYPLLFVIGSILMTSGTFPVRLDFAVTSTGMAAIALSGMLAIAMAIGEAVAYGWSDVWGGKGPLVASPTESSLETRFQYTVGGLIIILMIGLMVGDWIVAGNAARQMLEQRLRNTAQMGSESIPFFLETGQNLILQMASDSNLYRTPQSELSDILADHLRSAPYFRQLFVLDEDGQPVEGYPVQDFSSLFPTPEEQIGFDLARQGVAFQYYTVPPVEFDGAAQISFIAPILDDETEVRGVLLGRTDLATNPFTKPILGNLKSLSNIGGEGMLLDEEGRILYHPLPSLIMTAYTGRLAEEALFYDDIAPDGTRNLVYYQPVLGRPWAVVLMVSAQEAQQLALNIAAPLLGLLVLLSIVVFGLMRIGLRVVTASLRGLALEANRIAKGDLENPMQVQGEDEVGRLSQAFEEMRLRLKARLDELNQLLLVSQGVASSLEVETAVAPILDSALKTGASAARILLSPETLPDRDDGSLPEFGKGPSAENYRYLDEEILKLTNQQDRVLLTNPARVRSLQIEAGRPIPEAIFAVALRHESKYYGALWVGYDQAHKFADEEVRFITTLGGQAALAASNASLFLSAEIGRQRLQAIIASSPDPVLVTDHQNCLYLANPAATQLLAGGTHPSEGLPIQQVITNKELLALLEAPDDKQRSAEIPLPEKRFYYATASSVVADGKLVGQVCVLQDITRFKQLDTLKSEFVDSVSHDLRSPLTLMRGYATMLQMVGDLNDQQTSYVRKILGGVETMTRLVTNLLDLGRIEAGIGLKVEVVPVVDVVERVIGDLQLQADQKRIKLDADIPPHVTKLIEADQALIQQAVHNLVENAIKYTDAEGDVQVRVSERNAKLIIEVRDTGIGIAPVDQPRLFERFYRGVRRDTRQQRGSGLGLAIVKSIAERHGGRVWVESQLGKGSQFFLEIPLRQPDRSEPGSAPQDVV